MTEEVVIGQQSPKRRCRFRKIAFILFIVVLIVLIAVGGYGYFLFNKKNYSLTQQLAFLQKQNEMNQHDLSALQKTFTELKQTTEKSQSLSAQQEKIIDEWKAAQQGNLDKWHVAEAQYLIKLANDYLQYDHHLQMAMILIERAIQIINNLHNPQLLSLQQSLIADMVHLKAIPMPDVTTLYAQLTALNNQIDKLPLPVSPLKADTQKDQSTASQAGLSWWRVGLEQSWQALRKIVIIRRNNTNALPLMLPEEKTLLYQNLHAQMENAIWGVLHQNAAVYQTSLARMIAWISTYCVPEAPETKAMLSALYELQKNIVQPPTIDLSTTMTLFDRYFSEVETTKTT